MSRRTRTLLVFAGLVVVGLSLVVAPKVAPLVGLVRDDPADHSPSSPGDLGQMRARTSAAILELDQEIAIKDALASDLVAGRRTLDEVTDDFMLIMESRPVQLTAIRCQYEGGTDREKVARTVLRFASKQPGVSDEDLARLDTDFRALFPDASSVPASNATTTTTKGVRPRAMGVPPHTSKLIP